MGGPRPTLVRFSPAISDLLVMVARVRLAHKQRTGTPSLLIGSKMTEEVATLWGVRSEFAVAEVLGVGLGVDLTSHIWDGGVDLRTPAGATVQVKFSPNPQSRFALPAYENELKADYGVLVVADRDAEAVIVVGQISRPRFVELAYRVVIQRGEQLAVDQDALEPVQALRG